MLAPAGQSHALDFLTRQEDLQKKTQAIVRQNPKCDIGVIESFESLLRPSNLGFQFLNGQCGGV